jgi:predicted Zn-dependent peptidase
VPGEDAVNTTTRSRKAFVPRAVPPLAKPRAARMPAVAERVLPTGLRVVAVRRPTVPVVHVRLRIPSAVRRDADLAKAALLERTMLLGTADRSQPELAEALQRIGGSLRVGGDADRLLLAGESLRSGLADLLRLLTEVLVAATYPRDAVEGESRRLADQLRRAHSQPAVIADEAFLHRVYGGHPYGREHPQADEVLDVSAATLRSAHARRVVPDGSLLVLVGDLSPARALDQVARAMSGWDRDGSATTVPKLPPLEAGPLVLVDRPGAVQSNLRIGGRAPARTDPAYAAAELTNALFGGYFSSRLVTNIREDKGYTYSPRSAIRHSRAGSHLVTAADVATEVTAPALVETTYELARLTSLPPSADEVSATAQYLAGTLALSTATQSGLATTLSVLLADGLDVSWLREHPQRLLAVTPEQVHEAAQTMLAPSGLVTTVVGDATQVEAPLAAVTQVTRA